MSKGYNLPDLPFEDFFPLYDRFKETAIEAAQHNIPTEFVCPFCNAKTARCRQARGIIFAVCKQCQVSYVG